MTAHGLRESGLVTSLMPPQRSEPEFRRLLEVLPAAAYTCSPTGLINYYNQRAVQLWGRAPKLNDPVDRFCGSFKLFTSDGEPIAHDRCSMALALEKGIEFNGHEIVVERPDGRRVTVLAHANPFHDELGRLLGAVNVLVDINDRKRTEEALKAADRYKNEFLATLAHELRDPLAPIRNSVRILRQVDPSSSESLWAFDVIDRQMHRMSRLIDDLLDVARINGNKLVLRKERVELGEILHSALETSRPLIEAGGHELSVNVPAGTILLDADPTRLAQIVSNLLNNAAKYTERGGRIWLSAERIGDHAVITVRDTGIGIPPETLPRIFEMFAQGNRSLERARGGLGVGLSLVKRLVEMHGGTITAKSEGAGEGSEFVVHLPVMVEDVDASLRISHPGERAKPAASLRIVIVDDNRDTAASLGLLLRIMGNDVRTATDGVEAVKLAEEFRPDVAVLDIGLPGMDGYEAAQAIRQQPWGKEMVLIAVTGWGQESDRMRSREAGFNHHMVKPVEPSALLKILVDLTSA